VVYTFKWPKAQLCDAVGYRKKAAGKRTDLFLHHFRNAPSLLYSVLGMHNGVNGCTGWSQCNWSHQDVSAKKINVATT